MFFITFEEMKKEPVPCFRKLVDFLGIEGIDDECVPLRLRARSACGIARLRDPTRPAVHPQKCIAASVPPCPSASSYS